MQELPPGAREALTKDYCLAMEGNDSPWFCDLDKGHDGLHSGPNRMGIRISWGRFWLTGGPARTD